MEKMLIILGPWMNSWVTGFKAWGEMRGAPHDYYFTSSNLEKTVGGSRGSCLEPYLCKCLIDKGVDHLDVVELAIITQHKQHPSWWQLLHDLVLVLEENVFPRSWKEAKKVLQSISMEYHIIWDCILSCGDYKDMIEWPTCGEHRYKRSMLTRRCLKQQYIGSLSLGYCTKFYRCADLHG